MLSIIVAKAKNNVIGKNDELIMKLPAESKKFRELTEGKNVIMGRKTYDILGKYLRERNVIVFSNNPDFRVSTPNAKVVHSMLEIQQYIEDKNENYVIGGAMIYRLLMQYVTKLYVTEVDKDFDGDAVFPRINEEVCGKCSWYFFDSCFRKQICIVKDSEEFLSKWICVNFTIITGSFQRIVIYLFCEFLITQVHKIPILCKLLYLCIWSQPKHIRQIIGSCPCTKILIVITCCRLNRKFYFILHFIKFSSSIIKCILSAPTKNNHRNFCPVRTSCFFW